MEFLAGMFLVVVVGVIYWLKNKGNKMTCVVKYPDGGKAWFVDGELDRVESTNGDKWWFKNDNIHNDNGPAIEYANGNKEWYLNDKQVTEEEHERLTKLLRKTK